jgi:hypothetical protein
MASFFDSISRLISASASDAAFVGLTLIVLLLSGMFIVLCDRLMENKK